MKLLLPTWSLQSQAFLLCHRNMADVFTAPFVWWNPDAIQRCWVWSAGFLMKKKKKSPIEYVSFFLPCNTCMFAFYTRDVHCSEVTDMDSDLSLLNICLHVVLSNVYGRGLWMENCSLINCVLDRLFVAKSLWENKLKCPSSCVLNVFITLKHISQISLSFYYSPSYMRQHKHEIILW